MTCLGKTECKRALNVAKSTSAWTRRNKTVDQARVDHLEKAFSQGQQITMISVMIVRRLQKTKDGMGATLPSLTPPGQETLKESAMVRGQGVLRLSEKVPEYGDACLSV